MLPDELINQLNDSVGENAFVGGQATIRKDGVVEGQATVGGGEFDEDALLSDYTDKSDCSDDDVNAQVMQAEVDGAAIGTLVDEENKGTTETDVDFDSDGS